MSEALLAAAPGTTLVAGLMQHIQARISARELAPGARLPSIRALAEARGVSKSTVVEAYERLVAEGIIRARAGAGFYVAGHLAPLALADIGPRLDREIDPLWVTRQSLDAPAAALKPGSGHLPADWLCQDELRRALRSLARADGATLTAYAAAQGLPALREMLARRLQEHGIDGSPDQILLTDSATHSLDLICRTLLTPGATVLVDDPCYFNFHGLLRAHQVKVVGVPYTPDGPDLTAFAEALERHQPHLYLTNSGLHNPTGATLSPLVAHRLLSLAEAHDLVIVEDDIYADFELGRAPRLAALGGLERVVQVASFSKTLSGALRCGYIAARPDWIEKLTDLKIATSFSAGRLAADLVLQILKDGSYRRHMESVRQRLARAMSQTQARLRALGFEPWIEPEAGMFLWCHLPAGLDAGELARAALREDIVLAPGNVFSLSHSAREMMRFNVAQCGDPRIFAFLEAALQQAAARPAWRGGPRSQRED